MELTKLELNVLQFIDSKTWGEFKPIMIPISHGNRLKPVGFSQRVKIRWHKIQFLDRGKRRFTKNDHKFEIAIYNLKLNKLITSRTKSHNMPGLTCTLLGHEIAKKVSKSKLINKKERG